ncbi:hypothetical protein [Halorubrum trueperi]|uniref:Uncharacterized protein n=1 Tax=Halorubrum trueperi TaxID=2004704 RepID=A0ABD5UKU8_9EURY
MDRARAAVAGSSARVWSSVESDEYASPIFGRLKFASRPRRPTPQDLRDVFELGEAIRHMCREVGYDV